MDLNLSTGVGLGSGNALFDIIAATVIFGIPLGMIFAGRILDRLERAPRIAKGLRLAGTLVFSFMCALILFNIFF